MGILFKACRDWTDLGISKEQLEEYLEGEKQKWDINLEDDENEETE